MEDCRATLTEEEAERFRLCLDRQRVWLERCYARARATGFSARHPYTVRIRHAATALRALCLQVNGDCRKGSHIRYARRSEYWPSLED